MKEIVDLENKIKKSIHNLKGIFASAERIRKIGEQIGNGDIVRDANIIKMSCHFIVNLLTNADSDAEEIKGYTIKVAHDIESFEQHVERMLKNIE